MTTERAIIETCTCGESCSIRGYTADEALGFLAKWVKAHKCKPPAAIPVMPPPAYPPYGGPYWSIHPWSGVSNEG